jgi:hypothetical protein
MDEKIVALAKLRASQEGKSLDSLVEEGLRMALQIPATATMQTANAEAEPLEADDPFFSALDDIRNHGRTSPSRRATSLEE